MHHGVQADPWQAPQKSTRPKARTSTMQALYQYSIDPQAKPPDHIKKEPNPRTTLEPLTLNKTAEQNHPKEKPDAS
jgi:transcription termination factor NusB